MDNIELAGLSMHRQDREATSGKMRAGMSVYLSITAGVRCLILKEPSRYCSPEVEYLMISCRLHYLQRDFSSILFVAIYLPPQTDAGTKTALNQLYKAISKQEHAHPEAVLLKTLMQALHFTSMSHVQPEEKNSTLPLLHTQRCIQSSTSYSIWKIWP
jgi:hypothetical protein